MIKSILDLNYKLNVIIWGPLMIGAILSIGIYLTLGTRFIQFLKFPSVLKATLLKKKRKDLEGDISPFAALNVALAGTVGVGNIAGVATAIAMGGPGAIFWLLPIMLGSLGKLETVWAISDTLNGLMAIPNLIALFYLSPMVFALTKEFFRKA